MLITSTKPVKIISRKRKEIWRTFGSSSIQQERKRDILPSPFFFRCLQTDGLKTQKRIEGQTRERVRPFHHSKSKFIIAKRRPEIGSLFKS